MKYLKLFETFNEKDFDITELEDILMYITDYGFEFDDVSTGTAISIGDDYVDNTSHFSLNSTELEKRRYNNFSIRLKCKSEIVIDEQFFDELKLVVEQIESRYELSLDCIYTSYLKHVYYKNVDILKEKLLKDSQEVNVKFNKVDLMFKIL